MSPEIVAPRTVAVVVHRDRKDFLRRCLTRLGALDPGCARIVLVDDASSDGSPDMVRHEFPAVELVSARERMGPAKARNLGIRRVEEGSGPPPDFLLFLDDDAFAEPDMLGHLLAAAGDDPTVGLVVPKAYQSLRARRLHLAGELRVDFARGRIDPIGAGEVDRGQHDVRRDLVACSGFAILVRGEVVERIGGFDPDFFPPAWEDVDFALRAVRAGWRIVYQPAAVVEHVGGILGRGPIPERESAKVSNYFRLMRKHATVAEWAGFAARFPFRALGRLLQGLREGGPRRVAAWVGGAVGRHAPDARGDS